MTACVALTEIQSVAIEEAGHAIVAAHLGLPVQLVALWECNRGGFEGVVDYLHSDSSPFDNVAIAVAGRAAINIFDPACSFELFLADGTYPPWPTRSPFETDMGDRSPSCSPGATPIPTLWADKAVPDPPRLKDLHQAHALIDRLEPTPSMKRRRRILGEQWQRSREICRQRLAGVATLADALLAAYGAAEQRASAPGCQIRAEISGEKLTRLLEFAK